MRRLALLVALFQACATTSTPPPAVDVAPPSQYASIPRYVKGGPIEPPTVIGRHVEPLPPRGISGRATVETVIDETGHVVDSWLVDGNPFLARALIEAVRKNAYTPAKLDGRPIAVRVQETITVSSAVIR